MGMATNPANEIVDLADFDESKNILVYGNSGVGKTVWAKDAPGLLYLATEQGTISAARQGSSAKVWPLRTWDKFEKAMDYLRRGGYKNYKTLCLDSFTSAQDVCWRHILDLGAQNNAERDADLPYQQEHYKVQQVMKRVANTFCDMPIDVIFTALTMSEEEDGEDLSMPQIHGKRGDIAQYVMGQMSSVGHMVKEEGERRIYWEYDPPHYGKDRYGVLSPYTENKSYLDIHKMIERSGSGERPRRSTRRTTGRRTTKRKAS